MNHLLRKVKERLGDISMSLHVGILAANELQAIPDDDKPVSEAHARRVLRDLKKIRDRLEGTVGELVDSVPNSVLTAMERPCEPRIA